MKLISCFKCVSKREVLDCRIKSLIELAKFHGLNINSYDAMLISRSCTFCYGHLSIHNSVLSDIPYAIASRNDLEKIFFDSFDIQYETINVDASINGWTYLKKLLDSDIPVLFKIDSRFLNRNGTLPNNTKINIHYLSTLLLVGYDESKGVVYVVLTNSEEQQQIQNFKLDEFQKYRNTKCIPYSPNGLCYYINPDTDLASISTESINYQILKGILYSANEMLNGLKNQCERMEYSECNNLSFGIQAMKLMKKDLIKLLWYSSFKRKKKSYIQLSLLFLRNNLMFGSYSAFREEFGRSLCKFSEKINDSEIIRIGKDFITLSKDWKKFLAEIAKAGRGKKLPVSLALAVFRWNKVILKEKKAYKRLYKRINIIIKSI